MLEILTIFVVGVVFGFLGGVFAVRFLRGRGATKLSTSDVDNTRPLAETNAGRVEERERQVRKVLALFEEQQNEHADQREVDD